MFLLALEAKSLLLVLRLESPILRDRFRKVYVDLPEGVNLP